MALSKDLSKTEPGYTGQLTATGVYFKIVSLSGDKGGMSIAVDGACNGVSVFAGSYRFIPDLSSASNFIAQAYTYLKTLPEFSGATDC